MREKDSGGFRRSIGGGSAVLEADSQLGGGVDGISGSVMRDCVWKRGKQL